MSQEELASFTIAQAAQLIRQRELSPVELIASVVDRIDRLNPRLNAYITVLSDQAMQAARQAEEAIGAGHYRGPLHGIPVSLKDLYATKGVLTTAGSKILANWVPDFDATVVTRLKDAGAVIVGKAHTAEFATGSFSWLSHHFGLARNPWNPEHSCGGSSTGSGVSVAAGMALGSMGHDTGGSVRLPAALCGITGLKPTYGLISRNGIVPLSWSLDHAGPLTRTAQDAALMLQAVAGYDPRDPSSSHLPVPDFSRSLRDDIQGLRLGVLKGFADEITDDEVDKAVRQALTTLEELGAEIQEVSLPMLKYAEPVSEVITSTEAANWHEKWVRTRPQDYGPTQVQRFSYRVAPPGLPLPQGTANPYPDKQRVEPGAAACGRHREPYDSYHCASHWAGNRFRPGKGKVGWLACELPDPSLQPDWNACDQYLLWVFDHRPAHRLPDRGPALRGFYCVKGGPCLPTGHRLAHQAARYIARLAKLAI